MDTARNVSVPALRMLTYTVLIKAVLSAVVLICMTVAVAFAGLADYAPLISSVYAVARTAGLVNIVACVMCLGGIFALSNHFISTHRIMTLVALLGCIKILPAIIKANLAAGSDAAAIMDILALASEAVLRLLIGAAFLFFAKGFADVRRELGDDARAIATEKLGNAYMCCIIAMLIANMAYGAGAGRLASAMLMAVGLALVILELLIYRNVSDAAFRIWRKRAFGDAE